MTAGPSRRAASPPLVVLLPALLVGLALLLPLLYLIIRSAGASEEAWALLLRPQTAVTLGRTILLVVTVTASSVAIAVPIAWLTVRTDLPLRRLWSVLTMLPLVIPSFVGAFLFVSALGPKGLLQQLLAGAARRGSAAGDLRAARCDLDPGAVELSVCPPHGAGRAA